MDRDRADVLRDLVALNRPLGELHDELSRFQWDSENELVVLRRDHVVSALGRFLAGGLTAAHVEEWANAIEGRDDIGIDESDAGNLNEILFGLANPKLEAALTMEQAKVLLRVLDEDAS